MKAITAPTLSKGPIKLLYLEDDETDRRAFVRMVQEKKLPYELTHAQSLAEARARLAGATFDLIVADYHLPDGQSTELFDEVPETPFILITGTLDEQLALRTLERGADDYLPKDPRRHHLTAVPFTIDKVLHRKNLRERERLLTRQLQESEERFRTLFNAIDEGFCVIEVLFDQNQKPIDYRFLQTNPAFAKLLHTSDAEGKTGRELTPDVEQYWFDLFGKVALTGQPVRYQNRVAAWNRWFEGYAFSVGPLGNRQVGIIFSEITDRKRTEDALCESEERARLAVETAALGTYERNLATNKITMNPVCRQILGADQESPPQDIAPRSLHPDDADYVRTTVARAYDPALREVCAGEFRILRPDGSIRWVAGRGRVLFDDSTQPPTPEKFVGVLFDITDRKQAEEQLHESEERFAAFMRHLPGAAWMKDLAGRYAYANPEAERIFSTPWSELCGKTDEELFPPEIARQFSANDHRALAEGGKLQTTEVLRQADGLDRHSIVSKFAVLGADGQPAYVGGVAFDITDRIRAEEALRRRNQDLQILHQAAADLLLGREPAALLQRLHQQIATSFGAEVFLFYEANKGPGHFNLRAWSGVSAEEQRKLGMMRYGRAICARPAEALQPIIATHLQTVAAPNRRFVRKLGFRSYLYYPLMLNGHLQGTLAFASRQREDYDTAELEFFQTIARTLAEALERKRLESELQRHATQLESLVQERTAKLQEMVAELEHFSYTITHDMRAPLRAMRGLAGLLVEECGSCIRAERREYLQHIADASDRMDQLITDSLQYSLLVRGQFDLEPVDADALLRGILESYPQFQPPHAHIQINNRLPFVLANKAGLTQCFSNLLGNAVKFVQPGKTPEVLVWAEEIEGAGRAIGPPTESPMQQEGASQSLSSWHIPEQIAAAASPGTPYPSRVVRIWFEDKGIGIEREYHDKIWVMFQSLNRSYGGTGIGLALVRKAVERMGGRVGLESVPGQGSRFWVELQSATNHPDPNRAMERAHKEQ